MNSYAIDRGQWAKLTIFEQMGNAASEVGRSISAYKAGKLSRANSAFDRGLDLLDATIEVLVEQKSPRLREVILAREEYAGLFFNEKFETDADAIERYFMNYAIAARKQHARSASVAEA